MKKFKFRLQTLLNVTIAFEKEQKNKLAIINHQLNELKDKKQEVVNKAEEIKMSYSSALTLNEFLSYNQYLIHLKEVLVKINIEISMKEYEKMEAQNELIETMTKRKTYEKLKEKQLKLYKQELALDENKLLNDFISSRGGE